MSCHLAEGPLLLYLDPHVDTTGGEKEGVGIKKGGDSFSTPPGKAIVFLRHYPGMPCSRNAHAPLQKANFL